MKKILSYGSLNIDIVYSVPHFVAPGETIAARSVKRYPGGKGLNQSVALARAGAQVYHGGKLAADGMWLLELLRGSGADTGLVSQNGSATGTAVIQVTPQGENAIIIDHGANFEITESEIDRTLEGFGEGDLLVLQNEINDIGLIMQKAAARGMRIALNPSPVDEALLGMDLGSVSYLILNEIEGRAFTGSGEPDEICRRLLAKYPGMRVVLTLGGDGSVYADVAQSFRQPACRVKAVDTTAAGDTFTGFFLASVVGGAAPDEALSLAAKAAAIAVTRMGAAASIPTLEEVNATKL